MINCNELNGPLQFKGRVPYAVLRAFIFRTQIDLFDPTQKKIVNNAFTKHKTTMAQPPPKQHPGVCTLKDAMEYTARVVRQEHAEEVEIAEAAEPSWLRLQCV